ncbi:MAG: branched-chain amino acid ABC transporter permease [Rhodocyclales bacterium]|nr:branched-chain amino acid ABC transporter permease [Rhodocyclales bacterium]
MIYREAGQFKASYEADQQIFPIKQDRIVMAALVAAAFLVAPWAASEYWLQAVLTPVLVFALAALGLNLLTGYAGQLSLGTGAFMAVGAYATYNFLLRLDGLPFLVGLVLGGLSAAAVGVVFGLPSLRIKGFYLAMATLAAQFFIVWALTKFPWFSNYSSSGIITAQRIEILGFAFDTPARKYLLTLVIVSLLALAAKNLARTNTGRSWMAVRDMDVAAEVIGIPLMKTKLLAFAVSSFYCGIAGGLYAYTYLGTVEADGFGLDLSFKILFMIIIGGMGSVLGAFLGAAFILLLPVGLNVLMHTSVGALVPATLASNLELIVFGVLIIFFLIVEPHGLTRLWQIGKEKLRLWPFPH